MKLARQALRTGLLALLAGGASAQTPTGAIEGTVRDPSTAVVAGAKVTVTETATDRAITLHTYPSGRYSARNLLPGVYSIRMEAAGFSTRMIDAVAVSSGSVINGDATLELGRTDQVVQVTAAAISVDTTRQTVDTIITETEIKNIPRGLLALLSTTM